MAYVYSIILLWSCNSVRRRYIHNIYMYRITHRWRRSEWSHGSWSLTKFSSVLEFLLLFILFFYVYIYMYHDPTSAAPSTNWNRTEMVQNIANWSRFLSVIIDLPAASDNRVLLSFRLWPCPSSVYKWNNVFSYVYIVNTHAMYVYCI